MTKKLRDQKKRRNRYADALDGVEQKELAAKKAAEEDPE